MDKDTPQERIRTLCLDIMHIAHTQGWEWELDSRPKGKKGWSITVLEGPSKQTTTGVSQLSLTEDK